MKRGEAEWKEGAFPSPSVPDATLLVVLFLLFVLILLLLLFVVVLEFDEPVGESTLVLLVVVGPSVDDGRILADLPMYVQRYFMNNNNEKR